MPALMNKTISRESIPRRSRIRDASDSESRRKRERERERARERQGVLVHVQSAALYRDTCLSSLK